MTLYQPDFDPPHWTLTSHTDVIPISTWMPTSDPDWRTVDANGHAHFYDKVEGYPTLDYIIDSSYIDCDDEHDEPHTFVTSAHYECKLCHLAIIPGQLASGTQQYLPGQTTWTLTGVNTAGNYVVLYISEEEARTVTTTERPVHLLDLDDRWHYTVWRAQ